MTKDESITILNSYDLAFCDINGKPYSADEMAEAIEWAVLALKAGPNCVDCPLRKGASDA